MNQIANNQTGILAGATSTGSLPVSGEAYVRMVVRQIVNTKGRPVLMGAFEFDGRMVTCDVRVAANSLRDAMRLNANERVDVKGVWNEGSIQQATLSVLN